jgi:hypothetical protein
VATIDGLIVTARVIAWRSILLTFLASLFYGPAYAAAAAWRMSRQAWTFASAAARLGWTDGRRPVDGRRGTA